MGRWKAFLTGATAVLVGVLPISSASAGRYPDPLPDLATMPASSFVKNDGSVDGPGLRWWNPGNGARGHRLLVVTVGWTSRPYPADAAAVSRATFGPTRSLADYVARNSDGAQSVSPAGVPCAAAEGVVPLTDLGTPAAWDAAGTGSKLGMVIDALTAPATGAACLRLADFDADRDGRVDNAELTLLVLSADPPYIPADAGSGQTAFTSSRGAGAVLLDAGWQGAWSTSAGSFMTRVHEASHAMFGARDTYGFGVGSMDLFGPTIGDPYRWNMSAWQRMHLGWLHPTVVTSDGWYTVDKSDAAPPASGPETRAYLLYDPVRGPGDYLVVENRWNYYDGGPSSSYDQWTADSGLVVWRADDRVYESESADVRPVDLMRADGVAAPGCGAGGCYGGSRGDAWSGCRDQFPQHTMVRTWRDGTPSHVAVREIPAYGASMRVFFDVPGPGVMVSPSLPCDMSPVALSGGVSTRVTVRITNTGEVPDTFVARPTPLPIGWASTTTKVDLAPGASADAVVTVTPPKDAAGGVAQLDVEAVSQTDPSVTGSLPAPMAAEIGRKAPAPPTIALLDPPSGQVGAGGPVDVVGAGFGEATSVTVDGAKASFRQVGPGHLVVPLAATLTEGTHQITVTGPAGSATASYLVHAAPAAVQGDSPSADCPVPAHPGPPAVEIAAGRPWTPTRTVHLSLRWPACATGMRITAGSSFAGAPLRPVADDATLTLPAPSRGVGTARVSVLYVGGAAGSGTVVSDTIGVDLVPPQLKAAAATRLPAAPRWTFVLRARATDAGSGTARAMVASSTSGRSAITLPYRATMRVRLLGPTRPARLYLRVQDAAGLWSGWRPVPFR